MSSIVASKKFLKAELLQLNQTQIPSLGNFVNKKVGNQITTSTVLHQLLKLVNYT